MLWSRYKGKPHDCSGLSLRLGLFVSLSCGRRALTHRQRSAERRGARHTLQAEKAVEPRRPRARPLTLCLLRMKREDFITSCRPRLHPSSLPPPKPSLPPSLPSSFTTSPLPHSQPVATPGLSQPRVGGAECQRKPPIPPPASAAQCTETERDRERWGRRWRDREMHMVWIHKLLFVCFKMLHWVLCLRVVSV